MAKRSLEHWPYGSDSIDGGENLKSMKSNLTWQTSLSVTYSKISVANHVALNFKI